MNDPQEGEALLQPVMKNGKRLQTPESLGAIRERTAYNLEALPSGLQTLDQTTQYPVEISPCLIRLTQEIDKKIGLR